LAQRKPTSQVTRTPLSTSEDQRSRSPGRFAHRRVGASGGCSGGRENVLAVGNCCLVAVCSAAEGASAPTGEERGGGIPWRPPPTVCYVCVYVYVYLVPHSSYGWCRYIGVQLRLRMRVDNKPEIANAETKTNCTCQHVSGPAGSRVRGVVNLLTRLFRSNYCALSGRRRSVPIGSVRRRWRRRRRRPGERDATSSCDIFHCRMTTDTTSSYV